MAHGRACSEVCQTHKCIGDSGMALILMPQQEQGEGAIKKLQSRADLQ